MNGTLQTVDGRPALRFERHLPHPVQRVWRAVSDPAELARWMPAAAEWTPEPGEVFELGGLTGQITELDPPHVIAWTFGEQSFRIELQAEPHGCGLVFTHVLDEATPAAQTATGWACYLDRLAAQLAGETLSEERAHQPAGERQEGYAAQFGLDPAPGRTFIAGLAFRGLALESGPVLRLQRRQDAPVERVWRALTEPEQLRHWFPGQFEQRHSEPPHVLLGAWQGEGTLRFELRADGQGCALTFTHSFTEREQAALLAAGWDRCFARLDALLADQPMSEAAAMVDWAAVHERYAETWGIDPAIGRAATAGHTAG